MATAAVKKPRAGLKEYVVQRDLITIARYHGYLVHADQNGTKRAGRGNINAVRSGMVTGWPDLIFILPKGKCVFIELKSVTGKVDADQVRVHHEIALRGHHVHVVVATDGQDAWSKVKPILDAVKEGE